MISFLVSHWIATLCGGGILALLGAAGSAIGWPVVLKYWKEIVLAVCLVLIVVLTLGLYADLEREKALAAQFEANADKAIGEAETLSADNQNLVAQLKAQNDSIAAAQGAEFAARAAAAQALQAAQAKQAGDAKMIATLQARAADPKTNQGTCDEELQVIRAGL